MNFQWTSRTLHAIRSWTCLHIVWYSLWIRLIPCTSLVAYSHFSLCLILIKVDASSTRLQILSNNIFLLLRESLRRRSLQITLTYLLFNLVLSSIIWSCSISTTNNLRINLVTSYSTGIEISLRFSFLLTLLILSWSWIDSIVWIMNLVLRLQCVLI